VPIPFRDQEELEEWGTAAYLRLAPDPEQPGFRGALFQINGRGEPVEFTYNRVETPNSFLWRPADVRRAALRRLTASLLAACPRVPRVLFALAAEVPSELFCQDLQVALPVGRVAPALETAGYSTLEVIEDAEQAEASEGAPLQLFWYPAPPQDGTPERELVRRLSRGGLLLEPFERAAVGLAEVYGADAARP
jgi:hypothetical protein